MARRQSLPLLPLWSRKYGQAFYYRTPLKPHAEKRRLELLEEAYVKARYSLEWKISREDLEVLAQRIVVLRERTQAVCQAYIESLRDQPEPAWPAPHQEEGRAPSTFSK